MKLRAPTRTDVIMGCVFLLLNVVDIVTTLDGLHRFNQMGAYEANPVMAWALSHGDAFFVVFKLSICLLISLVTSIFVLPRRAFWFVLFGSIAVGLAILNNVGHYLYALYSV